MILDENVLTDKMFDYIHECDADELARIAGEMFGGKCHPYFDPEKDRMLGISGYEFIPNENYYGAFGEIKG